MLLLESLLLEKIEQKFAERVVENTNFLKREVD